MGRKHNFDPNERTSAGDNHLPREAKEAQEDHVVLRSPATPIGWREEEAAARLLACVSGARESVWLVGCGI